MKKEITTLGIKISIQKKNQTDYLSLTDIARFKNKNHTDDVIKNWLRNRFKIELLGLWETINNPLFNSVEFDGFRNEAGLNSFFLTSKNGLNLQMLSESFHHLVDMEVHLRTKTLHLNLPVGFLLSLSCT